MVVTCVISFTYKGCTQAFYNIENTQESILLISCRSSLLGCFPCSCEKCFTWHHSATNTLPVELWHQSTAHATADWQNFLWDKQTVSNILHLQVSTYAILFERS